MTEVLLSTGRKWLFSLVGFVLLPLLVLAGLELVLRLAGCGYPTAFFQRIRIGNQECLVENDKFGLRFFPPELARSPPPVVMKANKGARAYRIFLLGESAALGDPAPAYGAGRYLQMLLRERFPDVEFEVICGALTAINSHAVLPIARECARRQGDLWIVYMGNNEMVGPFGATAISGSQSPPLWQVRLSLGAQETRLGQVLLTLGRKLAGSAKHRSAWGEMQMFMENRIAPQDPRKEAVYRSFRRNLEDILWAGRRTGVPIILCTVGVNLKDCPPFASLLDAGLTAAEGQSHARLCAAALKAEAAGDFAGAAQKLEQAARIDPRFAELQFRWGECLLRLALETNAGETPAPLAARGHFQAACDADALPFRADSPLNAILGQAARQFAGPGLALCDAAAVLATNSPVGIAGSEAFWEHVHFNFDGNYLLARAWAEAAEGFLPAAATNRASAGWASQAACEQRLGLTDWNRCAVLDDLLQRLSRPPFTGQLNHTQRVEEVRGQMRALRRGMDRAAAAKARAVYLAALKEAPEDHRLHENFAQFLEAVGELPQAVAEWQRVRGLIPQHPVAYLQAGRLLVRQGELVAGRALLLQAVKMRPDLAEGWLELGNIHALEGEPELALKEYERVRQLAPQDPRAYYHIGKALSKLNRRAEASASLRHALQLRPDYWEGHYALGEELALAGQSAGARKEFEEVIRLKPDYPMAHLNLGVALVQEGDFDKALRHLEEAARLDPRNQAAREYLDQLRARRR
ncbi:MAG: tetratricopeptide repeat protein [Verrucomicrobiota bacterium]|jgi:tetratricopeptide (TPR) repeat protein